MKIIKEELQFEEILKQILEEYLKNQFKIIDYLCKLLYNICTSYMLYTSEEAMSQNQLNLKEDIQMKKDITDKQNGGLSKLALLRQKKGLKRIEGVDVEKAIDGFVSSIDTSAMVEEIKRNSANVNLIIDCSSSMMGTSEVIAQEINEFAARQAGKIYKTAISLTLFDDEVYPKLNNVDVKMFTPIHPWDCTGCTNIYDALFVAIAPIKNVNVSHRLHLIITDGENVHSSHNKMEVQNFISSKIAEGDHIFLLFNEERKRDGMNAAKSYAEELGIDPDNSVYFNRHGDGIKIIFQTIEELLDGLRTTGKISGDWSKAIEAHALNPSIKAREVKYLG